MPSRYKYLYFTRNFRKLTKKSAKNSIENGQSRNRNRKWTRFTGGETQMIISILKVYPSSFVIKEKLKQQNTN